MVPPVLRDLSRRWGMTTRCVNGPASHNFPIEDATGAYCPQHGVTLLFNPDPEGEPEYVDDDLVAPEPSPPVPVDQPQGAR